jgi:cyclase
MLAKRIIIVLTFYKGILYRTKKFISDYRYTHNFIGNKSADEIIILDVSRNFKYRKLFYSKIEELSENCFVPISVGGMINGIDEIRLLQRLGADKIVINSLFNSKPRLIYEIISNFGSQFLIAGIDLKKVNNKYEVYYDGGKKRVMMSFEKYLKRICSFNPGEILLQSIDNDGSLMGYDYNLINKAKKICNKPLLISGGAGSWYHFEKALKFDNLSGACTSNIYHLSETSINLLKKNLKKKKINVRES